MTQRHPITRQDERYLLGLCIGCRKPVTPPADTCDACLDRLAEAIGNAFCGLPGFHAHPRLPPAPPTRHGRAVGRSRERSRGNVASNLRTVNDPPNTQPKEKKP